MILLPRRPSFAPFPGHSAGGPFAQDLVLLVTFGEGGGSRIIDQFGQNVGIFHGTNLNWQSSPVGPAVVLDGSTNWVEIPANVQYTDVPHGTDQYGFSSRAHWIYWASSSESYGLVAGEEDSGDFNDSVFIKSDGTLAGYYGSGSNDPIGSVTLSAGQWYHYVQTYGPQRGMCYYINGQIVHQYSNFGGPSIGANNYRTRIGGGSIFGSGRYIAGAFASYAKWFRELDASEVQRLYQDPMSLYEPYRRIYAFVAGPSDIDGFGFGRASSRAFGAPGFVGHPGDQFIVGTGDGRTSSRSFGTGALAGGDNIIGSIGRPSSRAFGHGLLANANLIKGSYGRPSSRSFGVGAVTTKEFTIFISGVDVTEQMRVNTLDIMNSISQISTAAFTLGTQTKTATLLTYKVGQPVYIYHGNTRIFGGTIDSCYNTFLGVDSTVGPNMFEITCSDFSEVLDRRYVAATYNQDGSVFDLVSIVIDIVDTYLLQDNITYDASSGTNDSLANFGVVTFNWITARQAFQQLADLVQWDFSVDYYGVLRFFPSNDGSGLAPFNIADNDGNWLNTPPMTVQQYRTNYRNRQGVQSSSQSTALWTDTFSVADPGPFTSGPQPPDGIRQAFITLYGIPATPYVFVNDHAQVVIDVTQIGAAGPDGYQWYWIPPQGFAPSAGVFQNQADAPLTSADVLTVEYQSPLPPIIWVECADQIAIRAAIEGNSGVYEDVESVTGITDPNELAAYAQGLLNRYGCLNGMPQEVIYTTDNPNPLFAGMVQDISVTNPFVENAGFILVQVEIKDVDGKFLRTTVTADSGMYQLSSGAYYQALVNRGQLPQPSNRNTYTWQLAPSYPGVTNPGFTSGFIGQIQATLASSEVPLYVSIYCTSPPSVTGYLLQMAFNDAFFGPNTPIPLSAQQATGYFPTQAFPQGTILQPYIGGIGGTSGIKDGTITLVTSVIRN